MEVLEGQMPALEDSLDGELWRRIPIHGGWRRTGDFCPGFPAWPYQLVAPSWCPWIDPLSSAANGGPVPRSSSVVVHAWLE